MNIQSFLKKSIIWFCAALIPLTLGGNAIIVKKAVNDGMKFSVFLFYKNFIAALALLPYVIIRRNSLPSMTKKIFAHIMLLTILEPVMDQNFLYAGLKFTPATLSSCASALVPALTFIGSWIFGLEDVHITERRSQAKLLGTTIMTMGAIIAGVYAGPSIVVSSFDQNETLGQNLKENWVRGPALIIASLVSAVSYNILLGKTLNHYPAPLAVTGYVCMFGAPVNMVIAVGLEGRSRFSWLIIFDERLLAYLYGGIVVSCLTGYLQGRLTKIRGPVFFTAFSPLSMIFVTLVATFALKENLVLGRIMGVCFLLGGLAFLLWGKKSQETEGEDEHVEVIIESPVVTATKVEDDVVVQHDEPAPVETATESEVDVIVQSDEEVAEVDLHVGQSRWRNAILQGIFPQIFGLFTVKLAVALTLVGGVQHVDASGTNVRGEFRLLVVGDLAYARLMFRNEVTRLDAITAILCTESSMTTSAIVDSIGNALNSNFTENPDMEYTKQESLILEKLGSIDGFPEQVSMEGLSR